MNFIKISKYIRVLFIVSSVLVSILSSTLAQEKDDEVFIIGEDLEILERKDNSSLNDEKRREERLSNDQYLEQILDRDGDFRDDISGFSR